jgi:hypothetical protein
MFRRALWRCCQPLGLPTLQLGPRSANLHPSLEPWAFQLAPRASNRHPGPRTVTLEFALLGSLATQLPTELQ